jgi:hypothetical protein
LQIYIWFRFIALQTTLIPYLTYFLPAMILIHRSLFAGQQ